MLIARRLIQPEDLERALELQRSAAISWARSWWTWVSSPCATCWRRCPSSSHVPLVTLDGRRPSRPN
jgi:heterodisulfide reductase subunit C